MRIFAGVSTRGPYAGIGTSRHLGRRRHGRSRSSSYRAPQLTQSQLDNIVWSNPTPELRTAVLDHIQALDAIDAHHDAIQAKITRTRPAISFDIEAELADLKAGP